MRTHKIEWPTAATPVQWEQHQPRLLASLMREYEITWKVKFKLTHYCMHCI